MEIIGYILIATFFICVLIIIIGKAASLITQKKNRENSKVMSHTTSLGEIAIMMLKDAYKNNQALTFKDIYKLLEIPDTVIDEKNMNAIYSYLGIENGSQYSDLLNSYMLALSRRHDLLYKDLEEIVEHPLTLNNNEVVYFDQYTSLYEYKTQVSNISYSGFRWSSGLLRAGTLSYIKNELKSFRITDVGNIYITNKRLIFIGDKNYKSISIILNSVLTYYLYNDGIIIITSNRKPLLFEFEPLPFSLNPSEKEIEPMLSDQIFEFTTKLTRVLNGSIRRDRSILNDGNTIL